MKRRSLVATVICVMVAVMMLFTACASQAGGGEESKNPTEELQEQMEGGEQTGGTGEKVTKEDGSEIVIGVTLMSLRHPFYQDMQKEIDIAAEEYGITVQVADPDFDAGTQAQQIDDFIQQGVDGICVSPTDSKAVAPAVQKAIDAGIPVVTIDSLAEGVDDDLYLAHVASDNVKGGQLAAGLMIEALKERNITSGNVAIVDHGTVTSVQDRTKGFEEIMSKEMPDITIEHFEATGQRDKAMNCAEDAMQKYGDNLVGIFGINDDCALGSLSAVERANKLDSITVVGYDLGDESEAAIQEGKIKGDAVQFPGQMGRKAVEIIMNYAAGIETEVEWDQTIDVGTYTIDGYKDSEGNAIE